MSTDNLASPTVGDVLEGLYAVVEGDGEIDSEDYETAMERGLTSPQQAVARNYIGDGRVEVDESTIPCLADKLAAQKKLPWMFVLDGVEFVVRANYGEKRSSSTSVWDWHEDGYRIAFYKHEDSQDEVRFDVV